MGMFRKQSRKLPILICFVIIMLVIVACGVSVFYSVKNKREQVEAAQAKLDKRLEKARKGYVEGDGITVVGVSNLYFAKDQEDLIDRVKEYLAKDANGHVYNIIAFLNLSSQDTDHVYQFYCQIDDEHSSVIKGVYHEEKDVYDFTINPTLPEDVRSLVDVGGVDPDGEERLADLYSVELKPSYVKVVGLDETGLDEDSQKLIKKQIQRYFWFAEDMNNHPTKEVVLDTNFASDVKDETYLVFRFTSGSVLAEIYVYYYPKDDAVVVVPA